MPFRFMLSQCRHGLITALQKEIEPMATISRHPGSRLTQAVRWFWIACLALSHLLASGPAVSCEYRQMSTTDGATRASVQTIECHARSSPSTP